MSEKLGAFLLQDWQSSDLPRLVPADIEGVQLFEFHQSMFETFVMLRHLYYCRNSLPAPVFGQHCRRVLQSTETKNSLLTWALAHASVLKMCASCELRSSQRTMALCRIPFGLRSTLPLTTSTLPLYTTRVQRSFACMRPCWAGMAFARAWTCILSAMMGMQ